jgi:hypothetical protein
MAKTVPTSLTTDIIFEMGLTAGVTDQQGMITPSRHLILPSHLLEVRVALTRFCNCLLDYDCVLHIVNFAILYCICKPDRYNDSRACEILTEDETLETV